VSGVALVTEPSGPVLPDPMKFLLSWGPSLSVSVYDLGLACCAVEFVAASMARPDLFRPQLSGPDTATPQAGPVRAELMVVSGTVTDKMAPTVLRRYVAMPEPRYVISFGSCANCGGPYWDSYCVTKGVDQLIPVDVYVPGCPPRPEALLAGIRQLQAKIDGSPALAPAVSAAAVTSPLIRPPGP
jgi:NADH-quinone oxidoreductase subunit B